MKWHQPSMYNVHHFERLFATLLNRTHWRCCCYCNCCYCTTSAATIPRSPTSNLARFQMAKLVIRVPSIVVRSEGFTVTLLSELVKPSNLNVSRSGSVTSALSIYISHRLERLSVTPLNRRYWRCCCCCCCCFFSDPAVSQVAAAFVPRSPVWKPQSRA